MISQFLRFKKDMLLSLGFGQVISILIAGTGIFSTYLAQNDVNVPMGQSFFNYLLLSSYLLFRVLRNGFKPLHLAWWKYALLALADVEANFVIVLAYQYTSIASVMLLDCSTIPIVMILSYKFLHVRYTRQHLVGVFLCLMGVLIVVISDFLWARQEDENSSLGKDAFVGDLLCILASTLYAISNVGQEVVVKAYDRMEFLGMIGSWGFIISGIQVLLTERKEFAAVEWTATPVLYMAGFVMCMFLIYSLTSMFMQRCDATLFNLSLLTSDVWAVLAAYFLFSSSVSPFYFLAFAFIIVGLILYNMSPPQSNLSTFRKTSEAISSASTSNETSMHSRDSSRSSNSDVDHEDEWSQSIRLTSVVGPNYATESVSAKSSSTSPSS